MKQTKPTPLKLEGRTVCATGRFVNFTQADLGELVKSRGGRLVARPTRLTTILVIGDDGPPIDSVGQPNQCLKQAQRLINYGYTIHIYRETEFFESAGLRDRDDVQRLHTIADLSRMLHVSAAKIRFWTRIGLLQPAESVHRLQFFDFQQVSHAKRLAELLEQGATLPQIRGGLEQLQQWIPVDSLPFSQLGRLESDGQLQIRLSGRLFTPQGQRLFDFESEDAEPALLGVPHDQIEELESIQSLFDAALAAEDGGQYRQAIALYRQAIEIQPDDPVLHFNLGNVLYAAEAYQDAETSYRKALSQDPNYAEAWNNLGAALTEDGNDREALKAYRRAIELVPSFQAAQDNYDTQLGLLQSETGIRTLRLS